MKTIIWIIVSVLIVLAAGLFIFSGMHQDLAADNDAQVRETANHFGEQMKDVPLLAADEEVKRALKEAYGPYIVPQLLASWQEDPSKAPGRLTSSPWPDRIMIDAAERQNDETYIVTGSVVERTSTGDAGSYPVTLTVKDHNGQWLIAQFEGYPPETSEEEAGVPEAWLSYEDDAFDFSFQYPPSATVGIENDQVKVQLLGPGNIQASEVSDGFTLYLESQETALTPKDYAANLLADQPEYATELKPLQEVSIEGQTAYEFTVQSALGTPISYLIFSSDAGSVYVASFLISGQDDPQIEDYRNSIDEILATLRLRDQ